MRLFKKWTPPDKVTEACHRYSILHVSDSESVTESDEENLSESIASSTRVDHNVPDNQDSQNGSSTSETNVSALEAATASSPVASGSTEIDDRFVTVRKRITGTQKPTMQSKDQENIPIKPKYVKGKEEKGYAVRNNTSG